ncbi:bifunctional diguanylate cyclase/phosphodiesterase [Clostridium gasigenes]|uniref:Bifunctional diguanylate cyclase/phosphodiesterase n=1 Tax=Clostridium gasigenes TaxID=94869 RepID=A0A7X0SA79_9CLOT|nr:bifunctional diguanylate cyclase/phosphodiesterase [Clostridium gasigenes]MBB6713824.1 bifunctional diguanylate cyclase/phosphodiesterase [Clostridium gasigenes]
MKLSKKVTLIFLISTIFSLGFYKIMAYIMIDKMYSGENERISGIAGGVVTRFKSETNTIKVKGLDYATLIKASNNINKDFGINDGDYRVGLQEKMEEDNIEYKIMLKEDLSLDNIYLHSENDKDVVNKLISDVKGNYNGGMEPFNDIITANEKFYIVAVSPILKDGDSEVGRGYFLLAECIDEGLAQKIAKVLSRNVSLVYELEKPSIAKMGTTDNKETIINETDKVEVLSYYKITSVTGEECYLKLKESLLVRISATKTINRFTILVSIVFLIINILIFIIIKNVVVKRIVFINDEIKKVARNKQKNIITNKLRGRDEINDLAKDISDMVIFLDKSIDKMSYLANYDTVTNLQNRYSICNFMNTLIKEKKDYTIYYIDLDNFKSINDNLGHTIGDNVLCGVAKTLLSLEEAEVKVGRVGGDEFIIIREGTRSDEERIEFGNYFLKVLRQTFKYKSYTYHLSGSIGISAYPKHGENIETLLKYADIAMYRSKKSFNNKVQIISEDMIDEIEVEGMLSDALSRNEFIVYYQPILKLGLNKIVGAEALVRWNRSGEIIPPSKFIDIAKRSGEIANIDAIVLKEGIRVAKEFRDKGYKEFQISVNICFMLLKNDSFVIDLKEMLEEIDLESNALKIEITEDEILDDPKYIIGILNEIKKIGVQVSLDDFGSGYSSFNHIKILPIDTIKIDKTLLLEVDGDDKSKSIIESIINLSHSLGLDVICEGVEEENQLRLLESINCDKIQGYYISAPVNEEKFKKLLDNYSFI